MLIHESHVLYLNCGLELSLTCVILTVLCGKIQFNLMNNKEQALYLWVLLFIVALRFSVAVHLSVVLCLSFALCS